MVLADTSVWIQHFRRGDPTLRADLSDGRVLMHPFVLGELACGNLKNRAAVLAELNRLAKASVASNLEVLELLENQRLWGRGLGWVDLHLLASALLSHCGFRTFDKRLRGVGAELGLGW